METGQRIQIFTGHAASVKVLRFSSDARRLVSSASDNTVRLWDIGDGRQVASIPSSAGLHEISSDGKLIAINQLLGQIVGIHLAKTGRLIANLQLEQSPLKLVENGWYLPAKYSQSMTAMSFSPDGALLAGAGGLNIRIWDARSGQILQSWKSSISNINVRFDDSGTRLATLSYKGDITLWDPAHESTLVTLEGCGAASSFLFTKEQLICVAPDGTLRTWQTQSHYYPRARDVAEALLERHDLVSEAIRNLEADSKLNNDLRRAAIAEVRVRPDNLDPLDDWIASVVTRPESPQKDVRLALNRARGYCGAPPPARMEHRGGCSRVPAGQIQGSARSTFTQTDV